MGAYAEYTRIRPSRVMVMPSFMDFEQAAAFPIAVLTAGWRGDSAGSPA